MTKKQRTRSPQSLSHYSNDTERACIRMPPCDDGRERAFLLSWHLALPTDRRHARSQQDCERPHRCRWRMSELRVRLRAPRVRLWAFCRVGAAWVARGTLLPSSRAPSRPLPPHQTRVVEAQAWLGRRLGVRAICFAPSVGHPQRTLSFPGPLAYSLRSVSSRRPSRCAKLQSSLG